MRVKIYIILILLFSTKLLWSQDSDIRVCGSTEYMHSLEQQHPELITNRQSIENHIQKFIQEHKNDKKSRTIISIPVVVHVVYNLNNQNISQEQVESQIDVLNKDFRKLNPNFANTPGVFQPLAADCQIEFVLAKRTPNGDTTCGITRTFTNVTSFTYDDKVKYTAQGGKDAWPSSDYLNIWVCKLSGGLLGYAQFPGGPIATDGVVIASRAFGTMGTALKPFNKGRTATHEIGHWLNLYHIWGDDGGSCNGTDYVLDTPNQGAENTGDPVFPKISCNNAPSGDMFMNYMDYSNDSSMTMFTQGQKSRMDAIFSVGGPRLSILSSLGGISPTPPPPALVCDAPTSINLIDLTYRSIKLTWTGIQDAFEYNFAYQKDGDTSWTFILSNANSQFLNNLSDNTLYHFKIQSHCPFGVSEFSAVSSFTTSLAPQLVCEDNYEKNDFITAAKSIETDNSLRSMISTPFDNDYFQFTITPNQSNFKITLSELPLDYDLYLYSSNAILINTSQSGGINSEQIIWNGNVNKPTSFYARIKGYNGAYSDMNCYKLIIETSNNIFRENNIIQEKEAKPEIALYPIPAVDIFTASLYYEGNRDVICSIYNLLGNKVSSQSLKTIKGLNDVQFDVSSLSSGMYLLEVLDSEERRTQKFQITK